MSPLPFGRTPLHVAERIQRVLEQGAPAPLALIWTDNRHLLLRLRRDNRGRILLRLSRLFLQGGPEIESALLRFLRGERGKVARILRDFADRCDLNPSLRAIPAALTSRGQVFDLQPLFDQLNRRYFSGALRCAVGWGRRRKPGRRSCQFGSYCPRRNLIRLHPRLDQPHLPRYVVEGILYHEMLHAALSEEGKNRRGLRHDQVFRARERLFPDFQRCRCFERLILEGRWNWLAKGVA